MRLSEVSVSLWRAGLRTDWQLSQLHTVPRGSGDWNGILAADTLASPVSALERDASRLSRQPCWHPTEFTRE